MNEAAASDSAAGTAGSAGASSGSRPVRNAVLLLVCGVLPAALLATTVAVPAALWSRLPARVADHWTVAGTANGSAPRLVPFLLLGALVLAGDAVIWAGLAALPNLAASRNTARSGRAAGGGGRPLIATGLFMMCVGTECVVLVTVSNLGGGDLRSDSIGAGALAGLIGGPVALVSGATYLLRRYGGLAATAGTPDGSVRPSIGLRAGERAVWTGRARAPWAGPAAVVLVAAGAVIGAATGHWTTAAILVVIGVPLFALSSVRVTVAARGVSVGYGPLGLRLTRFPISRIAAAEAVDRTWRGFGYRGSLLTYGAAAVLVRRGPALKLTFRDGKTFLVTVDDADTGAALLNDLLKEPSGG